MSHLTFLLRRLKLLPSDRDGNIAILFGLCLIPLVLVVGMAIDMARAYAVKVRLGGALDAAALAVGSSNQNQFADPTLEQNYLQQRLQDFFTANYPNAAIGTPTTPSFSFDPNNHNVMNFSVSASVPTTFMRVTCVGDFHFACIDHMTVSVSNQVTRGISGLEVALVLDNTGSMMCGDQESTNCAGGTPPSHMTTMRNDLPTLINALFTASASDPSKLKVAIVPYVTSVNIGPAFSALGTLNTVVPHNATGGYNNYKGTNITDAGGANITYIASPSAPQTPTWAPTEWMGCVVEPTSANEDTTGNGPDITEPAGGWTAASMGASWTPYWWTSGTSAAPPAPEGNDNTWIWTTGTSPRVTHSAANFLESPNGDYAPLTGGGAPNYADAGAAYWHSYGPNLGCPMPLVPLTNNQQTLLDAANNLASRANSGTLMHVGMVWGWRVLSPNPPFSDPQPYPPAGKTINDNGWIKAVVLETDGENDVGTTSMTGLGKLADGKYGSTSSSTATTHMNNRLSTVCANMKAAGIVIYTVAFGTDAISGTASTALKNCASDSTKFFSAANAADLQTAFQQIANSLNNLRLSK